MWSGGDIIVSEGAAFVNHGTLLQEEPTGTSGANEAFAPRIRAPRVGERVWWRGDKDNEMVVVDVAVAAGGAGSPGGGAASWAWEELSYDA